MGKSPLHWAWVLMSLALQQRKDKKPKRGEKTSWEGQRKIFCVSGKETMGHGEGIKRTTSFSASQPCSLSYSLTLDQPVVPCFSHCSPVTAVVKLHPIRCVSPRDHEGSSALSMSDHISLLLCDDILIRSPPIQAYCKPLELSASPTNSAEQKPKDVPPFPLPLTSQPN